MTAGGIAVEDRQLVGVELLVGVFHGVHGHERIGQIRGRRSRKLGAVPVDAIDVPAAGKGLAGLRCGRRRAFIDLALDLTGAGLWAVEADLMVEAATALGRQRGAVIGARERAALIGCLPLPAIMGDRDAIDGAGGGRCVHADLCGLQAGLSGWQGLQLGLTVGIVDGRALIGLDLPNIGSTGHAGRLILRGRLKAQGRVVDAIGLRRAGPIVGLRAAIVGRVGLGEDHAETGSGRPDRDRGLLGLPHL